MAINLIIKRKRKGKRYKIKKIKMDMDKIVRKKNMQRTLDDDGGINGMEVF